MIQMKSYKNSQYLSCLPLTSTLMLSQNSWYADLTMGFSVLSLTLELPSGFVFLVPAFSDRSLADPALDGKDGLANLTEALSTAMTDE